MTRFDVNTAAWIDEAPADEPSKPLDGDRDVDIAIIGGGFTGVMSACHLSKRFPDKRIALVEAMRIGNGATGRNGGLVLNGITVKDHPPELAAREYAITNSAIDAIEALIRDENLPVRFRRTGCMHLSTTPAAAEDAHAWVEKLVALGLPLRWIDKPAVAGAHGAIFDPNEAMLAGVDLVRAVKRLLRTVEIFEHTQVTKIREGATIELSANGHAIRAKAIVLATSGYTPALGYFARGIVPVISHVIATDPLSPELRSSTGLGEIAGFFDDSPRLAYGGLDFEGRVVFGGGSTAAYGYRYGNGTAAATSDDNLAALKAKLDHYFPQLAATKIQKHWSGPIDLTLVRHCAIGVTGAHDNIFYGVGYSGHGITLANLAGRVIADLYAGDRDRWKDCAFYMRRPSGIPPEPLRWIGYHLYTKLTGKSPYKKLG